MGYTFVHDPTLYLPLHIGIATHPGRNPLALVMMTTWMRDFSLSPFFGGLHFVSESAVPEVPFPTVILNPTEWQHNHTFKHIREVQAAKLLLSVDFFLTRSRAPFLAALASDTYVWVDNLRFLFREIRARHMTGDSHFVWGDCVWQGYPFIQASAYLMSRFTARKLSRLGRAWYDGMHEVIDLDFMDAMRSMGLMNTSFASAFFMGQYCECNDHAALMTMNLSRFPDCPVRVEPNAPVCGSFQVPFNRVVFLHRLTWCAFHDQPIPLPQYPSTLYWGMKWIFPRFCVRRKWSMYPQDDGDV
jgi:hypothetical protein